MSADLLALRTTPTAMRVLAGALAAALFLTVSYLGVRQLDLTSAADAGRGVQTALAGGFVLFFGGLIAGTSPFRHGTMAGRVLVAPSRRAVVLGLAAATAALGALGGLVVAAATTALTLVLVGAGGGELPPAGTVAQVLVALPLYGALAAAAGTGLGVCLRSQPAALGLGLLLVLAVEPALASFSALVDELGPSGAAAGLVGIDDAPRPPALAGLALLVAYAGACVAAGVVATERRDL